jgi:hypothetical protein
MGDASGRRANWGPGAAFHFTLPVVVRENAPIELERMPAPRRAHLENEVTEAVSFGNFNRP